MSKGGVEDLEEMSRIGGKRSRGGGAAVELRREAEQEG